MNRRWMKIGLPLAIVALAVVVMMMMFGAKKPPEKAEVEERAFLVDAVTVQAEDLNFVVKSQGTVMPKIETDLSAQVSGKVIKVADVFIEGGMFREGDLLVQLEPADYMTDLKAAQAELAQAQAALEEEQARGKVAAEEWRSVKGSVAPELGLRKPQLAKEQANVLAAEAKVERANRNLDRTTIRAPYDGMVKSKLVDVGQFISTGSQLGTVYATDVAEVRMPLSDNDLTYLELPGATSQSREVRLYATVAGKQAEWKGVLARNEGILDSQRRVIYAIAEIADPYLRESDSSGTPLKFGRFVRADIVGNRGEGLMVLPRNVLRLDGTVLVVDKERKLDIREVNVVRADEQWVYISTGLRSGELVATSAIPNPYQGMPVRLPGEQESPAKDDVKDEASTEIASAGDNT